VTSRHLTHVLLQPVASVVNATPAAVCHSGAAADDIVIADQWRRSLVIDNNEPYVPMVSHVIGHFLVFKRNSSLQHNAGSHRHHFGAALLQRAFAICARVLYVCMFM